MAYEGMWLNILLTELKLEDGHPFKMMCENQAAMSIAKNPVHDRTKQIVIDLHFINEKIEKKVIDLNYIPSHLLNILLIYLVVRFYPICRESEGSFHFGNYLSEVEDLRAVTEYFKSVKRAAVVVLGHSKGGNVVLLYASKYHDIPAVVNVSGRYDLKRGLEERLGKNFLERLDKEGYIDIKTRTGEVEYQVTKESLMDRLNTNMHEACLSIDKGCRVLTVHGSVDEIIPVEDALEFAKIIPNHQLQIVDGANHGYSSHQDALSSAVLPFIKECMQQAEEVSE
ncbi:putative uncharacterized protein YDL057W [Primulina eburnea]|uniref:putative uncharacterized protein YDL057W n=1 Tax=Primulina eburnea TaxID=1245227 RepID=UPI003C6C39BA